MFQPLISASERPWPDDPPEVCCGAADSAAGDWSDSDGELRGERSPDALDTEDFSAAGESLADGVDVEAPVDDDSAAADWVGDSLAVGELSLPVISDDGVTAASALTALLGLGDAAFGVTLLELREAGFAATSWSVPWGCKNNPPVIVAAARPRAIRGRVIRFGIKVPPLTVRKNPNLRSAITQPRSNSETRVIPTRRGATRYDSGTSGSGGRYGTRRFLRSPVNN